MYDTLLMEFCQQEQVEYNKVIRMSPETFDELLALKCNDIAKEDTIMK